MSEVDCFDGAQMKMKSGASHPEDAKQEKDQTQNDNQDEADLLHIHPVFDGRFKDILGVLQTAENDSDTHPAWSVNHFTA